MNDVGQSEIHSNVEKLFQCNRHSKNKINLTRERDVNLRNVWRNE